MVTRRYGRRSVRRMARMGPVAYRRSRRRANMVAEYRLHGGSRYPYGSQYSLPGRGEYNPEVQRLLAHGLSRRAAHIRRIQNYREQPTTRAWPRRIHPRQVRRLHWGGHI